MLLIAASVLVAPPLQPAGAHSENLRPIDLVLNGGQASVTRYRTTPPVEGPQFLVVGDEAECGAQSNHCFSYRVHVDYPYAQPDTAQVRLRAGIKIEDSLAEGASRKNDEWAVHLVDPSGRVVSSAWPNLDVTDAKETTPVVAPAKGTWTLRVIPYTVNAECTPGQADADAPGCGPSVASVRAILEVNPAYSKPSAQPVPLLPDLRAVPAYGFLLGCLPTDSNPPPTCLRANFGFANVGDGPFDVRLAPPAGEGRDADAHQHVFLRDSTPWDYRDNQTVARPAGTASWHDAHGHWHYDPLYSGRLYRVSPTGTLVPAGVVHKRGGCAHDGNIARFRPASGDHVGAADSKAALGDRSDCSGTTPTNATDPSRARIALSTGWVDLYNAVLADQFVDFTGQLPGEYVLQLTVDADDAVQEVDESNNTSYTYFRFDGSGDPAFSILERGFGSSHLDPNRQVLRSVNE